MDDDHEAIDTRLCRVCNEREGSARYDRHGIYSGRACDQCAPSLPGQGDTWDYVASEPIEEDY